jgi:para-nitrobenzyl esterase
MRLKIALALVVVALPLVAQKPVKTESGDLVGVQQGTIRMYLGVPFAAPPVGPLRWAAPQPVKRSATPLPANKYGASCMQNVAHSRLPWSEPFMVQNEISEDCLYLNVWAPASGTGHPVLLYVHGGGFTEGSGSIVSYDGAALAKRGMVVIDINYRMGIFGFLATSALAAESGHSSAGNYGLLDMIAGLQWVHRNVTAFGGDPAKVLLAGQSAGSLGVEALIASPLAKGLFRSAAMDSGLAVGPAAVLSPLATAETTGDAWMAKHGGTLQALRAIPAADLQAMTDNPGRRPIMDGWVLTQNWDADLTHPVGSDVPVLAGYNGDEGAPQVGSLSAEAFRADAQKKYGAKADRFLALYPASTDAEASRSQVAAAHDRNIASVNLWAQLRAKGRTSATYVYFFERVPPWKAHPEFRAHHTSEVPYFFGALDKVTDRDYDATDHAVSLSASDAWIHLAETGEPGKGWPRATTPSGPVHVLGDTPSERPVPDAERAAFWQSVILQQP